MKQQNEIKGTGIRKENKQMRQTETKGEESRGEKK